MAWISLKFLWSLVSDFGLAICHPGSVSPVSVLRMTEHRITSLDKITNALLSNCQQQVSAKFIFKNSPSSNLITLFWIQQHSSCIHLMRIHYGLW